MGRGLVGHDVDSDAAPKQLGHHLGGVPDQPHAPAATLLLGGQRLGHRGVKVVGVLVEVPVLDPPREPGLVHIDDQAGTLVQGDRQRLRAAHAATAGGQGERAGQRAAEPLGGHGGERLVSSLDDPLGADVDPAAGRHLPVHRETEGLEATELGPGRPVPDQVRVRDQHPRSPFVRAEHAHGAAGLDQHRLVVGEGRQRSHQSVEGRPVPGCPAGSAVDDQRLGVLGDVRVEVVRQHPQRRLLRPAASAAAGATSGANRHRDAQVMDHQSLLPRVGLGPP